ncbi:aldehyde dehydrogenase family protein [Myxococcota bacterium]
MPYLSEDKIASIVERVVTRLQQGESRSSVPPSANPSGKAVSRPSVPRWSPPAAARGANLGRGIFGDLDSAVAAARDAFVRYAAMGLQVRHSVVAEMRREARRHVDTISKMAVDETGLGRVEHKIKKNGLVIDKTPGPEILEPWALSGDDGLTIEEYAPYGVIGSITPTTNPSETIICNGIGMIAAGNAVVFNVHPGAKKVSAFTVQFLNEAVVRAGGPENLLTMIAEPTIETAQALMRHAGIRLVVVTGGPGVVKEAMKSGKKVVAAGPGNPPAVVDETADLDQAAAGIVSGIGLDNNIICTCEKEIVAVSSITDRLKHLLVKHGAYEMTADEAEKMVKVVTENGHTNKATVGKNVEVMLGQIGVNPPPGTLIAFAEVPEDHPFVQIELLTPVTGLVRAADAREAIQTAMRCEQGNGHSACMYSKNIENLHNMARVINTSIFTKNAPTYSGLGMGGEGYTSFTIASPTGEGLTNARDFSRVRRCTLKDYFRIV